MPGVLRRVHVRLFRLPLPYPSADTCADIFGGARLKPKMLMKSGSSSENHQSVKFKGFQYGIFSWIVFSGIRLLRQAFYLLVASLERSGERSRARVGL